MREASGRVGNLTLKSEAYALRTSVVGIKGTRESALSLYSFLRSSRCYFSWGCSCPVPWQMHLETLRLSDLSFSKWYKVWWCGARGTCSGQRFLNAFCMSVKTCSHFPHPSAWSPATGRYRPNPDILGKENWHFSPVNFWVNLLLQTVVRNPKMSYSTTWWMSSASLHPKKREKSDVHHRSPTNFCLGLCGV